MVTTSLVPIRKQIVDLDKIQRKAIISPLLPYVVKRGEQPMASYDKPDETWKSIANSGSYRIYDRRSGVEIDITDTYK